jgi:hypothetical protein
MPVVDFASEWGELGIERQPAISSTISGWNDRFAPILLQKSKIERP